MTVSLISFLAIYPEIGRFHCIQKYHIPVSERPQSPQNNVSQFSAYWAQSGESIRGEHELNERGILRKKNLHVQENLLFRPLIPDPLDL